MTGTPLISHISDTARWVAAYRAMETDRPDALFRDPFARRLAGDRGEAIVQGLPKGRELAWPVIVRTALIDEIVLRAVARDGVDCVLNLAAGLDTRPWRLGLPSGLRWVDVDHQGVIDYKQSHLTGVPPRCRYEAVGLDLADRDRRRQLLTALGAAQQRVLVVTEGLLVYLTQDAVAELARDLGGQTRFGFCLIDLASPGLLRMLEKTWAPSLRAGNAAFRFAPAESSAFFAPYGWEEVDYRSLFEESIRLGRSMRFARLWALLGRLMPRKKREEFKRFSGVVLLARVDRLRAGGT